MNKKKFNRKERKEGAKHTKFKTKISLRTLLNLCDLCG